MTLPSASQAAPQPPRIPTGQELYDQIMGHLEPELTTEGLKALDVTYKDETPEQRMQRKQRYELAFERYEQAYQGYINTLQAQVERYRRSSFDQVEMEDRKEDEGLLGKISQSILAAT